MEDYSAIRKDGWNPEIILLSEMSETEKLRTLYFRSRVGYKNKNLNRKVQSPKAE